MSRIVGRIRSRWRCQSRATVPRTRWRWCSLSRSLRRAVWDKLEICSVLSMNDYCMLYTLLHHFSCYYSKQVKINILWFKITAFSYYLNPQKHPKSPDPRPASSVQILSQRRTDSSPRSRWWLVLWRRCRLSMLPSRCSCWRASRRSGKSRRNSRGTFASSCYRMSMR